MISCFKYSTSDFFWVVVDVSLMNIANFWLRALPRNFLIVIVRHGDTGVKPSKATKTMVCLWSSNNRGTSGGSKGDKGRKKYQCYYCWKYVSHWNLTNGLHKNRTYISENKFGSSDAIARYLWVGQTKFYQAPLTGTTMRKYVTIDHAMEVIYLLLKENSQECYFSLDELMDHIEGERPQLRKISPLELTYWSSSHLSNTWL